MNDSLRSAVAERVDRFLDGCVETADGCWVRTSNISRYGYSEFRMPDRSKRVGHRVVYEYMVADPGVLPLDHLCRNRACVNPYHLDPVTTAINNRRGKQHVTACPKGHAYDERNTYVTPRGSRACRTCRAHAARARRAA